MIFRPEQGTYSEGDDRVLWNATPCRMFESTQLPALQRVVASSSCKSRRRRAGYWGEYLGLRRKKWRGSSTFHNL